MSQAGINAAFYLRISMPKRQKTLVSSRRRGRLQTDVCSAFCTSQSAWDCSEQEFSKSSASKSTLQVALCGVGGTNFSATLDSPQLKILAQIWACLHLQTHPGRWKSLVGVSLLMEICSYRKGY